MLLRSNRQQPPLRQRRPQINRHGKKTPIHPSIHPSSCCCCQPPPYRPRRCNALTRCPLPPPAVPRHAQTTLTPSHACPPADWGEHEREPATDFRLPEGRPQHSSFLAVAYYHTSFRYSVILDSSIYLGHVVPSWLTRASARQPAGMPGTRRPHPPNAMREPYVLFEQSTGAARRCRPRVYSLWPLDKKVEAIDNCRRKSCPPAI